MDQTSKGIILALTCPCSKGCVCVNLCCGENQLLDTTGIRAKQIRRRAVIYVTLFVIGAVFLMATLVVHALLPNMRRAVRGLSLMAHCACMLAAHITLAVAQLIGANVTDVPCQIIAYLCQFTLLSGFFWLNVICLDISSAIIRSPLTARSLNSDFTAVLRTFLWYCIYAFGVPFILMVVTIGMDHGDLDHTNTFKPNIGLTACWFEIDSAAIILFFFGPLGLILLFNVVLFVFV
ncbi:hypothetical protein B566_EDAN017844 [Ephemera danica]|nr:hypothetical protein B566_EDAN017844 [Ephemera danica]